MKKEYKALDEVFRDLKVGESFEIENILGKFRITRIEDEKERRKR